LNDDLSEVHYNPASRGLVRSIFERCGKTAILDFFHDLGLPVYSNEGRLFPVTNQAASVLKVLEMELKRLAVAVEYDFDCCDVSPVKDGIRVLSKNGKSMECRKVIVTGGGGTYAAFGWEGSIYAVARRLGHTVIGPVPAAVPLVVKDSLCYFLQGQRISASAWSVVEGRKGREVRGELLFTKYGLSGTCILDISEEISIALNRESRTDVQVTVDMLPFIESAGSA
jgi:predicted Rossmann fold flavoprotein